MKEYYKILQVPFWASDEEVKKAYRILVQEHHPDKNEANLTADEKIKEINEAYTVLGNVEKRREYDFNCIVNNQYTSVRPSKEPEPAEKESTGFSNQNFSDSIREEVTSTTNKPNLHQQWKKVLLIILPVLATITVIYFLLPEQKQPRLEKAAEVVTSTNEAAIVDNIPKNFSSVNHGTITTKWQNDKLLYKLDLWMPAENKTPGQQSLIFFGKDVHISFFDKDGFKLADIPLQNSLEEAVWKRQDSLYTLTISDQAAMPLATYALLADWKMNQMPVANKIENTTPLAKDKPAPEKEVYISEESLPTTPLAPKKQAKTRVSNKASDDILNDESIRNGFKKNKQR
jgi:hypothetical protein